MLMSSCADARRTCAVKRFRKTGFKRVFKRGPWVGVGGWVGAPTDETDGRRIHTATLHLV